MIGKVTIVTALLAYGVMVGCALFPGGAVERVAQAREADAPALSVADSRKGLPYRAVGMQIQRVDWIEKYKKCVDEIADLGADTVKFVVDSRQENGTSSRVYLDMRCTPTPEKLQELIRHAKDRKLRVILMPIVLLDKPRGNEWRGTLKPESWDDWFESYREVINHFAWIAQSADVDVLVVGSELVSTEAKTEQWTKTINGARKIFKGKLTYSSNWDHYTAVTFWDQLDLIGMNSYWALGADNNVSLGEIQKRWKEIQANVLGFQKKMNKPLMFMEIGWCSLQNAAHEPWDYTRTELPVDLELQRKLYEGFFTSWYGNPGLGGFSVWEWSPESGGSNDKGYTPRGKPAERILREWLGKPRWDVK